LVVPKKHYENIFDIEEKILEKLILVTKKICQKYKDELGIEHINILQSNGKFAGQEVSHFHLHILPRKLNDKINIKFNSDLNNHDRLRNNYLKVKNLF
jgi:histidine triad (HIT) family protein